MAACWIHRAVLSWWRQRSHYAYFTYQPYRTALRYLKPTPPQTYGRTVAAYRPTLGRQAPARPKRSSAGALFEWYSMALRAINIGRLSGRKRKQESSSGEQLEPLSEGSVHEDSASVHLRRLRTLAAALAAAQTLTLPITRPKHTSSTPYGGHL